MLSWFRIANSGPGTSLNPDPIRIFIWIHNTYIFGFFAGRKLWDKVAQYVFENIYLPAAQNQVSSRCSKAAV